MSFDRSNLTRCCPDPGRRIGLDGLHCRDEQIPARGDRLDIARVSGRIAESVTQFLHRAVQTVVEFDKSVPRPQQLAQFLTGHQLAGPFEQRSQDLKRLLTQADANAVLTQLACPRVRLWAFSRQAFTCTGWEGFCIGRPDINSNDFGRRTPYVWQWMFDVQRELSDRVVIAAAYQGNAGHKLERYRVYDQAVHRTGPSDSTPFQQRQPWPEFNLIAQVDGAVNSTYNALTVKMESRYRKGLNFLVGYTWAKAIDSGSTIGINSGDRFPGNHYDLLSLAKQSDTFLGYVRLCMYGKYKRRTAGFRGPGEAPFQSDPVGRARL